MNAKQGTNSLLKLFKFQNDADNPIRTRRAKAQMTNIQVQNYLNCVSYAFKYTPVTQSILCLIFLMCAATMHH